MLLSIIVPVYNVDFNVFCRCINSIKNTNRFNYEIIIIDDGSKAEYSKMYDECIKNIKKDYIKIYHKVNGGVSSARNLGLKFSKGTYIMFVDADDEVNLNVIDDKLFNFNVDYIIFDRINVNENGITAIKSELNINEGKIEYIDLLRQFLIYNRCHTPWGKIIRKEILTKKNLKFDESMIQGEDAIFNLNIILEKPQIMYVKRNLYKYYNFKSTVNNRWKKNAKMMFENYMVLNQKKYENYKTYLNEKDDGAKFIENYIRNIFRVYKKVERFAAKDKECADIINKEISKIKSYKGNINIKSRLIMILMEYKLMWIFKFI